MAEWTAKVGCTLSPTYEDSPNFEMGSDTATVKAAVKKLLNDGDAAVNVVLAGNPDVTTIMIAATELVTFKQTYDVSSGEKMSSIASHCFRLYAKDTNKMCPTSTIF